MTRIDLDHGGEALVLEDASVSWRALRERRGAAGAGERVELHEQNSPELVGRLFALLRDGAVPVLAHPRWPKAMAARALSRAGAREPWRDGVAPATILFTSGSTGDPKAVVHDGAAHRASARASAARVPFGPGDRWLLTLPLCHVGGLSLLYRAAADGGALALPNPSTPLARALERLEPTHVSLVATQLRRLLDDDTARAALARARAVLVGGGPCPDALIVRALSAGIPVRQTYGCTEMASQVCTSTLAAPLACGAPLPGYDVRIDDGEIVARGPGLMRGVLRDGALQATGDDWYRTGDLGRVGAAGLVVEGRRDNRFISGGENVQPESIERALGDAGHDVIIVPVPDQEFGERPFAFVRGDVGGAEAVARERLPDFMRPVAWHPLEHEQSGLKPRRADLTRRARLLVR